jgi:N-carbamoylputrescine amidase
MGKQINLALIQMTCVEDIEQNYDKALGYIREAAGQGADIVCTQELFKSRYFCQVEDKANFRLAEEIADGCGTVAQLSELAAELGVVIVASLFEKRAVGLYHNTTVVLDADGTYLGKYRKMHIPDDPHYYEKFYFAPGDLGYRVFGTRYANLGVLVCWDQWYPEAARLSALAGAEIILIPTAIGHSSVDDEAGAEAYRDAWQIVQRGHAVANACFVAAVNRVGFEPSPQGQGGIDFWGTSFVSDPDGQILEEASTASERLLMCPIDLAAIAEARASSSYPFRDRRVDSYGDLTKLYLDA